VKTKSRIANIRDTEDSRTGTPEVLTRNKGIGYFSIS
jgi:hypothetical protein